MTPDILNFVPGSLVKMDKYIEVADGHLFKKKRVSINNILGNNGIPSLLLYINILFPPDLCN